MRFGRFGHPQQGKHMDELEQALMRAPRCPELRRCPALRTEGPGPAQPGERTVWVVNCSPQNLRSDHREDSRVFTAIPSGEAGDSEPKVDQEAQIGCKENPFPLRTVKQGSRFPVQGGCVDFILARLQAQMRQSPEISVLSSLVTFLQAVSAYEPAGAGGVERIDFFFFYPDVLLWLE